MKEVSYEQIKLVEFISDEEEYVYDIGMKNSEHNWFFGNGILLKNTDSVAYNSKIETNKGVYTIEELFDNRDLGWSYKGLNEGVTDKEFAYVNDLKVATYDNKTSSKILDDISYIYRHKVSKDQYEIQDEYGNVINITDDHSVMIERNGELIEVKPSEIEQDDLLIITE